MEETIDQDWPADYYVSRDEYNERVQNHELYINGAWHTLGQVREWLKDFLYGE